MVWFDGGGRSSEARVRISALYGPPNWANEYRAKVLRSWLETTEMVLFAQVSYVGRRAGRYAECTPPDSHSTRGPPNIRDLPTERARRARAQFRDLVAGLTARLLQHAVKLGICQVLHRFAASLKAFDDLFRDPHRSR
jgi:hypothetical protein